MYSLELFFGFPIEQDLERLLRKSTPQILRIFIDNKSEYLHELIHEEKRYLGKFLGEMATIDDLELIQSNIYSIVKRIAGECDFSSHPAVVLVTAQKRVP